MSAVTVFSMAIFIMADPAMCYSSRQEKCILPKTLVQPMQQSLQPISLKKANRLSFLKNKRAL